MKILSRYILGEIASHSLIGCALFTFILFMKDLGHILEMVVRNSSSFTTVLQVFLFTLPNTFLVTIPMAVLVGVLLGLSRLAADSEITAMRASGFGIWYFVRVASVVALIGTGLGLVNSLYLSPRANRAILEMQRELETSQASFEIQPRVFLGLQEHGHLCAGCAVGDGGFGLAEAISGGRAGPGFAADYYCRIGYRGAGPG